MSDDTTKLQEQLDALKEQIETEKAKNAGLLEDLKKAQREARSKQEIKPEDLAAAEERADKAEADLAKLKGDVKALTTRAEKAEKALEGEAGYTSRLLVDNGLNAALAEAGVKEPALLKAAKALLGSGLQVVTEGDERIVKAGDKTLADFVKEWAGGDDAKHFISAPANGGGGAPGGKGGNDNVKTMTRAEYNEKVISDPAGTQAFIRDGGKVVNDAA